MNSIRTGVRLLAIAIVVMISAHIASPSAFAAGETILFATAPEGISASVWATEEIDELSESTSLGLEQIAIDLCSATSFAGSNAGPVLVFAESFTFAVTIGDDVTMLQQGESTLIPSGQDFRISNGMVDGAFRASALLLYPLDDEREPLDREVMTEGTAFTEWGEESFCEVIESEMETTLFVTGSAKAGATQLYIGSVLWEGGATTEGHAIVDTAASFNVVILSGGMGNGGLGTGRATYVGPHQEVVMNDSEATDFPGMSGPFSNPGTAPVYALVFGSSTPGEPIYVAS
jgi:hypothetical protein